MRAAGSFSTSRPRTSITKILFWKRTAERPNPPPPRGGVTPPVPSKPVDQVLVPALRLALRTHGARVEAGADIAVSGA